MLIQKWISVRALIATCVLVLSGCMQLDTHIKLNEDGSATITEKIRFSRKLLDLSGAAGSETDIAGLLRKEIAQERTKVLGKGVTLEKYEVRDVEEGAKEAVAIYKIEDITELHYVSPFRAMKDYNENNTVRFIITPRMSSNWQGWKAGELGLELKTLKPAVGHPKIELKPGEAPPPSPAPSTVQMYRDLQPMFQEMLKDFTFKLTFECYGQFRSQFGMRGVSSGAKTIDYINITDKNLDARGGKFFENEEIMLEILQGKFHDDNVVGNVNAWVNNLTLPVFHAWGSGSKEATWRPGNEIFFRPSQALFKKHFEGKELTFEENKQPVKRLATFEEIGFKPDIK